MQKKHGFAPLGAADGPVKTAIFGGNNARSTASSRSARCSSCRRDRFAAMKAEYEKAGPEPSQHALRLRGAERAGRLLGVCVIVTCPAAFPGCCAARSGALLIRGPSHLTHEWVPALRSSVRTLHRVRDASHFVSAGSRCTGSIHNTVSGFSTGSMSRLITTASPSLRTSTHSSTSSRLALISWCGT